MNRLRSLFTFHKSVALAVLTFPLAGFAEDPIVVYYSDPSLARMEAQIGVTPAQRDRFDDIIVKYRTHSVARFPKTRVREIYARAERGTEAALAKLTKVKPGWLPEEEKPMHRVKS